MEKEEILIKISELTNLFETAAHKLRCDLFSTDSKQLSIICAVKKVSEEIEGIDLDVLFLNAAAAKLDITVFNELRKKLGIFESLYFKKEVYKQTDYLLLLRENQTELLNINKQIEILNKDIRETFYNESGMSENERSKVLLEFMKEKKMLDQERVQVIQDTDWITRQYYENVQLKCIIIEGKINTFFHNPQIKTIIFSKLFVENLIKLLVEYDVVKNNKQVDLESFYSILNFGTPEKDIKDTVYSTKFASIMSTVLIPKLPQEKIPQEDWEKHVIPSLGIKMKTYKAHKHKNDWTFEIKEKLKEFET